jgi:hypothetical protein
MLSIALQVALVLSRQGSGEILVEAIIPKFVSMEPVPQRTNGRLVMPLPRMMLPETLIFMILYPMQIDSGLIPQAA